MFTYVLTELNDQQEVIVTQLIMIRQKSFMAPDNQRRYKEWPACATQTDKDAIGFKTITNGEAPSFNPETEYLVTHDLVVGQVFAPRVITKTEYTPEEIIERNNAEAVDELDDLGPEVALSRKLEDFIDFCIEEEVQTKNGPVTEELLQEKKPFLGNARTAKKNWRGKIIK